MSTAIHQPDTPPISTGSPPLLESKRGSSSGQLTPSPSRNEECGSRSGSSSPSSTPNNIVSFTPPTNGILTPPNDVDTPNEGIKQDRSSGRLTFYKDGVLCLELSHQDDGERRKWVQVRAKTVFPTIIHAKKEVSIPFHPSPSSNSPLQQRVESCTSHCTSDDGSSMLSSPHPRESSWRKPVPRRKTLVHVEFYFKAAPCIRKFPNRSKARRQPYLKSLNSTSIDLQCSCDSSSVRPTKDLVEHSEQDPCNSSIRLSKICRKRNRPSVSQIVNKIRTELDQRVKTPKVKQLLNRFQEAEKRKDEKHVLPKKRAFRDTDMKDSHNVRPAKVSPKTKSPKQTILNIPGFTNDPANEYGPLLHLKAGQNREGSRNRLSKSWNEDNLTYLSSLPPEQQQLLQQQTMSKAISYTINSLLSPRNQEPSKQSKNGKSDNFRRERSGSDSRSSELLRMHPSFGHDQNSFLRHLLDTSDPIPQPQQNKSSPNSSATSSEGRPKSSQPSASSSSGCSNSNLIRSPEKDRQHNNARKTKEMKPDSPKTKHNPSPSPQHPHPPQLPQSGFPTQFAPGINLFPPAAFFPPMFPGGFPLGYEALLNGQNAGALAAAYQSMIPPNLLSLNPAIMAQYFGVMPQHLVPPGASIPSPVVSTSAPSTSSRTSESNQSDRQKRMHANMSSPPRRESPYHQIPILKGSSAPIPIPFHKPSAERDRSSSHTASACRTIYQNPFPDRRNNRALPPRTEDNDGDAPLNLSKK